MTRQTELSFVRLSDKPRAPTGGGILAGGSFTVQNCTVAGNQGDGIQISSDGRVGNNFAPFPRQLTILER